jgi:uncharacterized membrane protein
MYTLIKTTAQYVAYAAEGAATLIIVIGAAQAAWIYARYALFSKSDHSAITRSRLKLGHALSLGLEFLIGADILKTAVAPTWDDIGQLAAIVGIRTLLNFFLMREMERAEDHLELE